MEQVILGPSRLDLVDA